MGVVIGGPLPIFFTLSIFNKSSIISWQTILLVEKTLPRRRPQPATSNWYDSSYIVVSSTPLYSWDSNTSLVVTDTSFICRCNRNWFVMQGPVSIILISWNVIFIWETGYWTRAIKRFALFDLLNSLYSDTKILSKYIPSLQRR